MSQSTITKTIFVDASPDTVWLYLTDKDKLAQWFHPARNNLELNKEYELYDKDNSGGADKMCWGTVTEMKIPQRLVYTFTVKPLNGAMTTVTWTLESALGGTRLTLLHEGVGDAAGDAALGLLRALDKGWDEHFGRLRPACEAA